MIITRKWKTDGKKQWTSNIKFCCEEMADEILNIHKQILDFEIVKFCPWCGDEIRRIEE